MNAPDRVPLLAALAADTAPGIRPPWTVLCVDDEPHILLALQRTLRRAGYLVLTASSGARALLALQEHPVDVVVCDMQMPVMDGAQLLEELHARWPDVARVLLTGHASVDAAMAAINRGRVLRYLRKPWDDAELLSCVLEAVERAALQRERDRLQALTQQQNGELRTLNTGLEARVAARTQELQDAHARLQRNHLATIEVFANLLELRGDQLAGHARRVAHTAQDIARALQLDAVQVQHVFVAGLLHDIGLIGSDAPLLVKPLARYTGAELALYRQHTERAEQLLLALDDMQPLLPLIRSHHERFNGEGFPDKLAGDAIPLGARILALADAYDDLQQGLLMEPALTAEQARAVLLQGRGTQYCPRVLDAFLALHGSTLPDAAAAAAPAVRVPSSRLEPGMLLARDLVSSRGVLMLMSGHRLTASLIRRVREFETREGNALQIHIHPHSPTPP